MKKIIYCLLDKKIGHIRQSEGLALALQSFGDQQIIIQNIPTFSFWGYLFSFGRCLTKIEPNSIIIGTGHRTHFGLIIYRWLYRAKTIVIMKPSLPKSWFNYCIIPRHDEVLEQGNVIVTEGAMNSLSLMVAEKIQQILILIGGPSSSCEWDNESVYQQLLEMVGRASGDFKIVLSTSRRTPDSFLKKLPQTLKDRLDIVDFQNVNSSWLPTELLKSQEAWVTAESISMIYEALSANCEVKTIEVNGLKGKMAKNLDHLADRQMINRHDYKSSVRLNESYRVAKQLLELGLINDRVD